MIEKGNLLIISAPSGSGKTSLAERVLKDIQGIQFSVSHTTRQPRAGEKNGIEYFFVNVSEFEEMIKGDEFLEYAHVYGNYYGTSRSFIEKQLRAGLDGIDSKNIVVAYEPVWAISGGDASHKAATPDDAQQMHAFVRKILADIYSEEVANEMTVLYGGSMKPENVKELMAQPDIDGGLVGGASLEVEKFVNTIKFK